MGCGELVSLGKRSGLTCKRVARMRSHGCLQAPLPRRSAAPGCKASWAAHHTQPPALPRACSGRAQVLLDCMRAVAAEHGGKTLGQVAINWTM